MENKIIKKVELDAVKSFNNGKVPSFYEDNFYGPETKHYDEKYDSWGRFATDAILDNGVIFGNIPTIGLEKFMKIGEWKTSDEGKRVLRYSTMMAIYNNIVDIIKKSRYFKKCVRKMKSTTVEISDNMWKEYFAEKGIEIDYTDPLERFFSDEERLMALSRGDIENNYKIDNGIIVCVPYQYEKLLRLFGVFSYEETDKDEDSTYFYLSKLPIADYDSENYVAVKNGDDYKYYAKKVECDIHSIKEFFEFVKERNNTLAISNEKISKPFINLNFSISEDYRDNGEMTPHLQYWEPNKKYYLDDYVLYNYETTYGEVYRLIRGNAYEITQINGELYNIIIKKRKYNTSRPNHSYEKSVYYLDPNNNLFLYTPYYKGYFDPLKLITYFDNPNGPLTHWEKMLDVSKTVLGGSTITATTESSLSEMMRFNRSYDENGVELPFNIKTLNGKSLRTTELQFRIGHKTVKNNNDGLVASGIEDIKAYAYSDGKKTEIDVSECVENGVITVREGVFDTVSSITVKYYKNAEVDEDGNIIEGTGVHYTETHPANLSYYYALVDEPEKKVWNEYNEEIDAENVAKVGIITVSGDEIESIISDSALEKTKVGTIVGAVEDNDTYRNILKEEGGAERLLNMLKDGVISIEEVSFFQCVGEFLFLDVKYGDPFNTATMEYSETMFEKDEFYKTVAFKDETMNGIHYTNKSIDTKFERGKSAAYERHNILGEINTFEDLENYRNNYFNL